jgi:hypothetical protein
MGTPAQVGKQQYKAALNDARRANVNGRQILRRLMNEAPSQLIRALAGQLAMELSDNDSALNQLDEIGKTLRDTQGKL